MGPYYVKLTKGAMKLLGHDDDSMTLDRIIHGSVRTGSLSPEVTDSAAAATAYATGARTFNQNVSVINGKLMPTVLEGAEGVGMWTGLVTTARITHATPAAFSAHVSDRNKENDIAEQQLEQGIELLMGGGRQHFLPKGESGSKREDDRDMEAYAREKGYNLIHTEEELHSAMIPALGLFSPSHMAFEMDRERLRTEQPSLAQMTRRALQLLAAAPDGFFLMVEGGRIDHAGHMNDPVAAVHEVLAYDEAVAEVLKFAAWDNSTLVISAADHETGGLFQGENEFPDYAALAGISSSMEALADEFHRAVRAVGKPDEEAAARKVLRMAGVPDANLTSEEVSSLIEVADEVGIEYLEGGLPLKLGEAISRVLHVNWTTSHHTDVDVSLGVFGGESLRIKNNIDNSELGDAVIEALKLTRGRGTASRMAAARRTTATSRERSPASADPEGKHNSWGRALNRD
eukprot:CAMPEP_0177623910 /NCGR_PEP_ID=MMETSP0419_2-20121207/29174_1 /TAXON_ID=582737 /ORGANISM="Tetraselmis sp., Strain GSL018" /LENGTH=458 /DNA_ID=CAMNT_0019124533 /DNA_START=375 /DNA_END=1749 /DNA_ORIENTATION=-